MTTVKTIIVYDDLGNIIRCDNADMVEAPMEGNYLIAEVPAGAIVKYVDMSNMEPIYITNPLAISDIDRLGAKMDYIAMVGGVDINHVEDVFRLGDKKSTKGRNEHFQRVLMYRLTDLWTDAAVLSAVGLWITETEYATILSIKDQQGIANATPDTEHEVPTVVAGE